MIIKRGRYVRFIYKAFEYVYECILVPFSLNTDIRYSQFVWYTGTSVNWHSIVDERRRLLMSLFDELSKGFAQKKAIK